MSLKNVAIEEPGGKRSLVIKIVIKKITCSSTEKRGYMYLLYVLCLRQRKRTRHTM